MSTQDPLVSISARTSASEEKKRNAKSFAEQWNVTVAVTSKALGNAQKSANKAIAAVDKKLQEQKQNLKPSMETITSAFIREGSPTERTDDNNPQAMERMMEESKKMVTALDKGAKQLGGQIGGAFKSTASWVTKGANELKKKAQEDYILPVDPFSNIPKSPAKSPAKVESDEEDSLFAIENESDDDEPSFASSVGGHSAFVNLTKGEAVAQDDVRSPHVACFPFKKMPKSANNNWWSKAMSTVIPKLVPRLACLCLNQLLVFEERDAEFVCKSNRRISSIKRMSYEPKKPNEVTFFYRDKEKTNIYFFEDAEGFIKNLQDRLSALNIGMKSR